MSDDEGKTGGAPGLKKMDEEEDVKTPVHLLPPPADDHEDNDDEGVEPPSPSVKELMKTFEGKSSTKAQQTVASLTAQLRIKEQLMREDFDKVRRIDDANEWTSSRLHQEVSYLNRQLEQYDKLAQLLVPLLMKEKKEEEMWDEERRKRKLFREMEAVAYLAQTHHDRETLATMAQNQPPPPINLMPPTPPPQTSTSTAMTTAAATGAIVLQPPPHTSTATSTAMATIPRPPYRTPGHCNATAGRATNRVRNPAEYRYRCYHDTVKRIVDKVEWEVEHGRCEGLQPKMATAKMLLKELVPKFDDAVAELIESGEEAAEFNLQQERVAFLEKVAKLEAEVAVSSDPAVAATASVADKEKLPKRELPQFTGDAKEWLSFWAIYKSIHEDKGIREERKFDYLIQSTKPGSEAHKLVTSYPVAPEYYSQVIEDLKQRFGRPKVLTKVYVRELLKLGAEISAGKMNFTDLVTKVSSQIRNLEILGVTQEESEAILYPVVESCVPPNKLEIWMRSPVHEEKLKGLLQFLQQEVHHEAERKLARAPFSVDKKDGGSKAQDKKSPVTAATFSSQSTPATCIFCKGKHCSHECYKAQKMTLEERKECAKAARFCFACIRGPHFSFKCNIKKKLTCGRCQRHHETLMCGASIPLAADVTSSPAPQNPSTSTSTAPGGTSQTQTQLTNLSSHTVPLQTVTALLHERNGKVREVRVMLDGGSQTSSVLQTVADEVELLMVGKQRVVHQLFGGVQSDPVTHEIRKLAISDMKMKSSFTFDTCCVEKIAQKIITPPPGPWIEEFARRGIIFPDIHSKNPTVDVLIGNDVLANFYTGRIEKLGYGPLAMETSFGWVLCGKLPGQSRSESVGSMMVTSLLTQERPISDLWALETIGIRESAEVESKKELEAKTQQHFEETVSRDEDGRYEVHLPFLEGASSKLSSNYFVAERRLRSTTRKLKDDGLWPKYDLLFRTWEQDGMIEEVPEVERGSPGHYLPHQAVVKLSSSTTPIRPVFDASARAKESPSLNQCLESGPNLLELIPSIVTRFRLNKVGVTADIKKAFQQILVTPQHRDYLRFLWWTGEDCREIKVYRHRRVVFGVTSSPYLLLATLKHHLKHAPESHADTAEKLAKSLYVDNAVVSVRDATAADTFKKQCEDLLLPAQFDLRGWEFGPTEEEKSLPLLGLTWKTKADTLAVDTSSLEKKTGEKATQRKVLSAVHSLFDPLGFLTPFVLQAKTILRGCVERKLGWDKELPDDLQEEFRKWMSQVPLLMEAAIPRYTGYDEADDVELHLFCDASGSAYAAVGFLRCVTPDGIIVTFLQAKSRVAPQVKKSGGKTASIARLELVAATIGSRLARSLLHDMENDEIPLLMWSDSAVTLAWIAGEGPWGVFVTNRVTEIRNLTNLDNWSHVPGKDNPADLPSRGCNAQKLLELQWWNGPPWLQLEAASWPSSSTEPDTDEVEKEKKKMVVSCHVTTEDPTLDHLLRISTFAGMLRVVRTWLRIRHRLLQKVRWRRGEPIFPDPEPVDLMEEAERSIIRHAQKCLPSDPVWLSRMNASLDEFGVLRMKTRLLEEEEAFSNPILLPRKNPFVRRLLHHHHHRHHHAGSQILAGILRERFWIVDSRREVRAVVTKCVPCKRMSSRRLEAPEGPLPTFRTKAKVAFEATGVDLAGPLFLRGGKKVWVVIFSCATYRAIHLELVDTMSTDAFLLALRRFVARRGRPKQLYSDNGLNFVGAKRVLDTVDWEKVFQYAIVERIRWTHSVAQAPRRGAFFERMIGLVKQLLRRILGKRVVHQEELMTLLAEVEEVLNNRPLTYLAEAPEDMIPLTPNHFARGNVLAHLPEVDVKDGRSLRAAFKKMQHLREALRSRFRKEYLGALKQRQWTGKTPPILREGDVVLVEDLNKKRVHWPMAVILETILGVDQVTRTYKLRTTAGIITRPAQRLFPLELQEEQE